MPARALMIQGTGSDVGKSVLVAGLCRIARRRGIDVAPFKPQNMSNNAAACPAGGEIGRAQALQAAAAEIEPEPDQNPVLLKPETDRIAQIVVHGRATASTDAAAYMHSRDALMGAVVESFGRLQRRHSLILVEGAGSPAETNLRARDIANMGFALRVDVPVCLLGDIDRGGVIASLVGTQAVIDADDARQIAGFAINKFRGDAALFDDGIADIEARTGWPCFGVIPWLRAAARLPAEDAVSYARPVDSQRDAVRIVAPMLSRMANFDDADPLRFEPGVDFRFVPPGEPLPGDSDLVVLFGTKSTLGDLNFLRKQGWDHDIIAHARRGGRVLGVCGGYQLLGRRIVDETGVDGRAGSVPGLGLLNVVTAMRTEKQVRPVAARCAETDHPVHGYEIHNGETQGTDTVRPMFVVDGEPEGAQSIDRRIQGTYLHGLMTSDDYRRQFLQNIGAATSALDYAASVDGALNELADGLEAALDIDRLLAVAR